ncbi:hypothetical protein [Phyllobacterium sp. SB3]|uniref:hypothetical protein n=1 Tax=Phyllobacterium sp. SB3 TaxID=3156073 RepID=UPI0032AEC231
MAGSRDRAIGDVWQMTGRSSATTRPKALKAPSDGAARAVAGDVLHGLDQFVVKDAAIILACHGAQLEVVTRVPGSAIRNKFCVDDV